MGNQLFEYATGYAAAKRLHTNLVLDATSFAHSPLRSYELDGFNLEYDKILRINVSWPTLLRRIAGRLVRNYIASTNKKFKEKRPFCYDEKFKNIKNDTYLKGYFQSYKYFEDYHKELLAMLTPNYEMSEGCRQYIKQVHECESVAVHVRRGDYVRIGICLDKDYYIKAIETVRGSLESPTFFVMSDDVDDAEKMFEGINGRFVYVKYQSATPTLDDFFIMKNTKHMIMANSSYSFWAAYCHAEDSVIVCPYTQSWRENFFLPHWKGIEVDIRK